MCIRDSLLSIGTVAGSSLQNVFEIEGLRLSEAKIFRCAGSLRRCAPALARRLRRRGYPDLYVDLRRPGGPVGTPGEFHENRRFLSFSKIFKDGRKMDISRGAFPWRA